MLFHSALLGAFAWNACSSSVSLAFRKLNCCCSKISGAKSRWRLFAASTTFVSKISRESFFDWPDSCLKAIALSSFSFLFADMLLPIASPITLSSFASRSTRAHCELVLRGCKNCRNCRKIIPSYYDLCLLASSVDHNLLQSRKLLFQIAVRGLTSLSNTSK